MHQNQPYDESVDVADAEEVASVYAPSPSVQQRGGGGILGPAPTAPVKCYDTRRVAVVLCCTKMSMINRVNRNIISTH